MSSQHGRCRKHGVYSRAARNIQGLRATPKPHLGLCVAMKVCNAGPGGWLTSAGPPKGAFPFVAPSWHPQRDRMARGVATPIGAVPRWLWPCLKPTRPARTPLGSPEVHIGHPISPSAPLRDLGSWPEWADGAPWRAPKGRHMGPEAHSDRALSPWASYEPPLARVVEGLRRRLHEVIFFVTFFLWCRTTQKSER